MRPISRLTRTVALFSMLTLTPLTFSHSGRVEENQACSAEHVGCVQELDSVCTAGGKPVINYYNRSSR